MTTPPFGYDPYALRRYDDGGAGPHRLTQRVDYDVYCTAADLAVNQQWPPLRFSERDQRLYLLDAFSRGDLSNFGIAEVAGVNYFHSYSTKLTNLLLMSKPLVGPPPEGSAAEPEALIEQQPRAAPEGDQPQEPETSEPPELEIIEPPEDERLNLSDGAYDALYDMTRYGIALIAVTEGELEIVEPLTFYPAADGGAYTVLPFTSPYALDSLPDRARVRYYPAFDDGTADAPIDDGTAAEGLQLDQVPEDEAAQASAATEWLREWEAGKLGAYLSPEDAGYGEAGRTFDTTGIVSAQRTPRRGIWGTATYLEIAGPIIEINRRSAKNSKLLDAYSGPIARKKVSYEDAQHRFPVDHPADPGMPTEDEKMQAIIEGARKEFEEGIIVARDEVQEYDFLQPNVSGVMTSISQMDEMRNAIQSMTGLPSLTGEQQPPSGEALKRIYLPFYAESSALQETLRLALERLFGEEVEWPHVFDVIELEDRGRLEANARLFAPRDRDDLDDEDDEDDE